MTDVLTAFIIFNFTKKLSKKLFCILYQLHSHRENYHLNFFHLLHDLFHSTVFKLYLAKSLKAKELPKYSNPENGFQLFNYYFEIEISLFFISTTTQQHLWVMLFVT